MIERHSKVFVPVSVVDAAKLDVDKIIKVSKGHKEGGYFPYGFAEEKENVYVLSEQELERFSIDFVNKLLDEFQKDKNTSSEKIFKEFLKSKTNPQNE